MSKASVTADHLRLLSLILLANLAMMLPTVTLGAADNSEIPRTIAELRQRIAQILEKHSVPGAGLALVSKGTITWVGGVGVADVETSESITKDTHFRLGSCTKSFVGLGFLRLLEEGRIDLSVPVRDIVPEIEIDNPWSDTDPVRVIHLLEHTSGFDDSRFRSVWAYTGPETSLRKALASTASSRRVRWRPGSRYAYSNPGYALAGYVLERVTGEPYEDFLRETILRPLGMTTSTFRLTDESRRLLATGYSAGGAPTPYSHIYHPAGSLNSTAQEMGLFVHFLLNHGQSGQTALLGNSIDRLGTHTTTLAAQAGLEMAYGFGVSQYFRGGFRCFGHSGGSPGFISRYSYIPDVGLGCVLLLNKLDEEALDETFKLVFDFLTRDATAPVKAAELQLPVAQLGTFAGYYELRSSRIELLRFLDILLGGVTVTLENDGLRQQQFMSARTAMLPVSSNTFRAPDEPAASKIFLAVPEDRMVLVADPVPWTVG